MADTFCIQPWQYAEVLGAGHVQPCCEFRKPISQDGSLMSLRDYTLEEIWNSDHLRGVRRNMVEGRADPGCAFCHQREAAGAVSSRLIWNAGYAADPDFVRALKARAAADDFRAAPGPSRLELNLGNRCNLKCRTCTKLWSSRIALDPTHRAWHTGLDLAEWWQPGEHWLDHWEALQPQLFQHAEQIELLQFIGGEPFLYPEIAGVLRHLIGRGVARNITVCIVTNATSTNSAWLGLTEHFAGLDLTLSIDGFGATYEYIRYPARWEPLVRNIRFFQQLPHATLRASVTVQNGNVLSVVELFRFLDSVGLDWIANTVGFPAHLGPANLPPAGRKRAAERLEAYAWWDCKPANRDKALGIAGELRAAGEEWDRDQFREFMLFTNDLDVTRRQSIHDACPELVAIAKEAGVVWTRETRHATRHPLPVV